MLWHKTKTKPNSDFYQNRKQFWPKDTFRCWWRQHRGFAGCCLIGRLHSRRKNQLVIVCWSPACQVWLWCLRWGLSSDDDDLEAVGGANKLSQETQIPRNFSLHWILVRLTGWEVGEFSETFLYFPTIACYLYLGRSSSVLKYQT